MDFVVFLDHSTEEYEVMIMECEDKQVGVPAQSWVIRVERKHPSEIDYYSQLRCWVQHAILEAEKSGDFKKKDRFLSLLRDL
jgi:hypothetical protein